MDCFETVENSIERENDVHLNILVFQPCLTMFFPHKTLLQSCKKKKMLVTRENAGNPCNFSQFHTMFSSLPKFFFPRIDDSHCDRIHSSLTTVRCFDNGYVGKQPVAWKEYCVEY